MLLSILLLPVTFFIASAAPTAAVNPPLGLFCKKAAFILAGDSTTASISANGGGWGDGFKNYTLISPSFAENHGVNGKSTKTYVEIGEWGRVLDATTKYASNFNVYVTIQFGHNDQKLANFETQFQENLKKMVADVKSAGGIPVLVTPLSRRNFNPDGSIRDKLAPWAGYTQAVANATNTITIDLWKTSLEFLEHVGELQARRMDLADGDHTHLNAAGSIVFGRMVSDLLVRKIGEPVACVTKKNVTMSAYIDMGVMPF
ncbi:GDSL-like Lipase/Acylhydrolase [Trichophaea hybrida]|nr:GDSL-like Lipase/Acylhydrolase [Trichophaea hybrida]